MATTTRVFLLIFFFSIIFSILNHSFLFFTTIEIGLFVAFFFRSSRKLNISGGIIAPPPVSIIISMRNEEENVAGCVESLTSLDYPNFEIIVGDDASTDNTNKLLREAINKNQDKAPIKLFTVPPIENGWTGKTWAVSQLVKEAKGDLILVTDADTRYSPESLKNSVSHFLKTKADIMVRFPYPIVKGMGEWPTLFLFFILRFSSWFSLSLFRQRQAVAKEECLMFTKKCYTELGGYESFKSAYPMILAFFNSAFKAGKNVVILDDDNIEIKASSYDGFKGTTNGILERVNFRHVGAYSFLGIFIAISFATDSISKILSGIFAGDSRLLLMGLASYFIFAVIFGVYLAMSRQPVYISIFGPILGFHLLIVSLFAIARMAFNKPLHWKGRTVQVQ